LSPLEKSIHLKISGKISLETVRVASLLLLSLPLDQAYLWIYDAPGCDTHFRVQGSGFKVRGFGFRVEGLGFGVWGLGFGVWGLGFGVWGLGIGFGV